MLIEKRGIEEQLCIQRRVGVLEVARDDEIRFGYKSDRIVRVKTYLTKYITMTARSHTLPWFHAHSPRPHLTSGIITHHPRLVVSRNVLLDLEIKL